MSKALALLLMAMMALHLVKPLGILGLKRRGDVWKIAVFALAAMMLTVLVRP
ncbi:hypothetical protein ACLE20_07975 [Rhizobium sp. YIM 134829]|uniref:hypothetical protein n=1 Tax=Rhizobium sp. YIM 134829 TaxID=3390453 RepID=UPI00397BE856